MEQNQSSDILPVEPSQPSQPRLTTMPRTLQKSDGPHIAVGGEGRAVHMADGVLRGARQIVGASLLGGVLAGAIGGAATIPLGALVIGAEELGLLTGAALGIVGLFLTRQ